MEVWFIYRGGDELHGRLNNLNLVVNTIEGDFCPTKGQFIEMQCIYEIKKSP